MLPWVTILMVMMMKRDTASADITNITATSGERLKLSPDLRTGRMGTGLEFRWTHPHLLLDNRNTRCHHDRCELLEDGSLSFSRVQPEDSGVYTLEVYNLQGKRQHEKVFRLQVEEINQSRTTAIVCSLLLLLILLLLIISFLLWRRRLLSSRTSGAAGQRKVKGRPRSTWKCVVTMATRIKRRRKRRRKNLFMFPVILEFLLSRPRTSMSDGQSECCTVGPAKQSAVLWGWPIRTLCCRAGRSEEFRIGQSECCAAGPANQNAALWGWPITALRYGAGQSEHCAMGLANQNAVLRGWPIRTLCCRAGQSSNVLQGRPIGANQEGPIRTLRFRASKSEQSGTGQAEHFAAEPANQNAVQQGWPIRAIRDRPIRALQGWHSAVIG